MKSTLLQRRLYKSSFVTVALVVTLLQAGCGGGGIYIDTPPFDIHVIVGGQPLTGVVFSPGPVQRVSMRAGQSIELNANESVTWSLNVGGTTVSGPGVAVSYGGVSITLTELTASRVAIDTSVRYPLSAPLFMTLVATSTYDFAQVATIEVRLTP